MNQQMKFSELGKVFGGSMLCDELNGTCTGYSDDCNTFIGTCTDFTGNCKSFTSPPEKQKLMYY